MFVSYLFASDLIVAIRSLAGLTCAVCSFIFLESLFVVFVVFCTLWAGHLQHGSSWRVGGALSCQMGWGEGVSLGLFYLFFWSGSTRFNCFFGSPTSRRGRWSIDWHQRVQRACWTPPLTRVNALWTSTQYSGCPGFLRLSPAIHCRNANIWGFFSCCLSLWHLRCVKIVQDFRNKLKVLFLMIKNEFFDHDDQNGRLTKRDFGFIYLYIYFKLYIQSNRLDKW